MFFLQGSKYMYTGAFLSTSIIATIPVVPLAEVARRVHRSLIPFTGPCPIIASFRLHVSRREKSFFSLIKVSRGVPSVVVVGKESFKSASSLVASQPMNSPTVLALETCVRKSLGSSIR